jgi:hypothetical protein
MLEVSAALLDVKPFFHFDVHGNHYDVHAIHNDWHLGLHTQIDLVTAFNLFAEGKTELSVLSLIL